MKQCFKCGDKKPLSEFYRHKKMADGHLNKCKACTKQDVHSHRHGKGRERVLAFDMKRANYPHRIALRAKKTAAWRAAHPDRKQAQSLLGAAVRTGKILPWPVCAVPDCCSKPEAHHPDYSRPLDVVWLCSAHHKQAHALASPLAAST